MTISFWLCVLAGGLFALLLLAFPLYQPFLRLLASLRRRPATDHPEQTPSATLVISAFNEEDVLRDKLANSTKIDYPDLRFVVVSDCSSDGTDAIVEEYAATDQRVRLHRMEERGGKTLGLNSAMQTIETDVVIFTDANAMFEPDAIRHLVRPLADPKVGYVVGAAIYTDEKGTIGAKTEGRYWDKELRIKELESNVSSVVGADGAIYAIRRELFEPLLVTDINDFVNPLQIIAKGYRGVFEPRAKCFEETTGSVGREIARKGRIVNRSMAGLMRVPTVLNPFRFGLFSVQLWLHKVVRWFSPVLALLIFVLLACASFGYPWLRPPVWIGAVGGALLGMLYLAGVRASPIPFVTELMYAVGVALASTRGIMRALRGDVATTWQTKRKPGDGGGDVRVVTALSFVIALLPFVLVLASIVPGTGTVLGVCALLSVLGLFAHLLLFVLPLALGRKSEPDAAPQPEDWPAVTLLISAHNEEKVVRAKLENALETDYPGAWQVVIASDGSSDATDEIAREFEAQGVRLHRNDPRTGKAGMIRRVSETIETPITVLSDCNAMYEPGAIRALVARFEDEQVGAVTGRVDLLDENDDQPCQTWSSRAEQWLLEQESHDGSCVGVDGAMVAVRTDLLPPYRDGTILDDFVLAMHVANEGRRVVFEGRARGHEGSAESLRAEFERRARITAGVLQLYQWSTGLPTAASGMVARFIGHKVFRWCSPLYAVSTLVVMGQLLGWIPALVITVAGVAAVTIGLGLRDGVRAGVARVLQIGVFQLGTFAGLARGLRQRQSGMWKRTER
ncbi:MAG: glycosyltransferase [Planctomycetota bacterium]